MPSSFAVLGVNIHESKVMEAVVTTPTKRAISVVAFLKSIKGTISSHQHPPNETPDLTTATTTATTTKPPTTTTATTSDNAINNNRHPNDIREQGFYHGRIDSD
jgi:hypothetical protein